MTFTYAATFQWNFVCFNACSLSAIDEGCGKWFAFVLVIYTLFPFVPCSAPYKCGLIKISLMIIIEQSTRFDHNFCHLTRVFHLLVSTDTLASHTELLSHYDVYPSRHVNLRCLYRLVSNKTFQSLCKIADGHCNVVRNYILLQKITIFASSLSSSDDESLQRGSQNGRQAEIRICIAAVNLRLLILSISLGNVPIRSIQHYGNPAIWQPWASGQSCHSYENVIL